MKQSQKILSNILIMAAMFAIMIPVASANEAKPSLPGLTVADQYPKGCVDCHKAFGGKDFRLNRGLAAIEGHDDMGDDVIRNVPQDCMKCHTDGGDAEPLGDSLHRIHFGNPDKNVFVVHQQGNCLYCHHINPESGEMTIKSGPRNW